MADAVERSQSRKSAISDGWSLECVSRARSVSSCGRVIPVPTRAALRNRRHARCTWPYVDMRAPNLMRVFIVYPLGVESILLRAGPSVKRTFLLRGSIRATYVS